MQARCGRGRTETGARRNITVGKGGTEYQLRELDKAGAQLDSCDFTVHAPMTKSVTCVRRGVLAA